MVTMTWAVAALHGCAVSVSVTVPAAVSPAEGLYVAFSVVAFGAKLPVPEDDQAPPVAPTPTVPPRAAVLLAAQIVWLAPALAVAGRVNRQHRRRGGGHDENTVPVTMTWY